MPKTNFFSHFALSLLGALSLHASAQNVSAVAGTALAASAAAASASAARPAGAASGVAVARVSADTKRAEVSKQEGKGPVGTLSSAKTIRELLEIDDQIALSKERKALADETKKTEKEPVANAPVNLTLAVTAREAAENKANAIKQANAVASSIKIDAIMGIQGERVINANIAGTQTWIRETNPTPIAGWLMVAVKGSCATFERNEASAPKAKKVRAAKGKKLHQSNGVQTTEQTVCFKRPEAFLPPPAFGSSGGGAGAMPMPVPLPFPAPFSTPPRVAPVAPIATL